MDELARTGRPLTPRAEAAPGRTWIRVGVPILVAAALAALSAYEGYRVVARWGMLPPRLPSTVTVARGALTPTRSLVGVSYADVQAKLSFTTAALTTGTVVRSVDVALGERVSAGQPLVALDNRSAMRAVEQAGASLGAARIALEQLTTLAPSDVAAATQVVAAASASLQRAQNDRATLRRGSPADSIAAASQAALTAQNALAAAQTEVDVLQLRVRARSTAEELRRQLDAANAQLGAAESDLDARLAESASARFIAPAAEDVTKAVEERCRDIGNRDVCIDIAAAAPDLTALMAQLVARTSSARDLVPLESSFRRALAGATAAQAIEGSVFRQAQALAMRPGLQARHEATIFTITPYGTPTPDDLLTAARSRDAARQAADSAQERLRTLIGGPTIEELSNAEQGVSSARAALDAALAAQGALGSGGSSVALQQQRVLLAESALRSAQDALDDSVLRAPFDGVVATLSVRAGDAVVPGTPVVTVFDPAAIAVRLTVSDADIARLASGQLGVVRFDALAGQPYVVSIEGLGGAPNAAAGPPTFEVRARVLSSREVMDAGSRLDPLLPALGMARGANASDRAALLERIAAQPQPLVGVPGAIAFPDAPRASALLVPSTAIRRDGARPVVVVVGADGTTSERRVVLGASDGQATEVTDGLVEGEAVVERVAERAGSSAP